ncbi:MAG: hypothetical protein ACREVN_13515 [Gammaproteobacteria bacterium]
MGKAQGWLAASALLALTSCPAACDTPETTASRAPDAPQAAIPEAASAEIPDSLLERVKADLVQRENVSVESIRTLSAEPVVWRDMSMGCGGPTESYAQIDVEGFRIILEHDGRRFDYRARSDGTFVLCDPAQLKTPRRQPE